MALGYILIGSIVGLITFFGAIILGQSFGTALLLYSVLGSMFAILLPLTQVAIGALRGLFAGKPAGQTLILAGQLPAEPSAFAPLLDAPNPDMTMQILAVDDVPSILELVAIIAAQAGCFSVTSAASGQLALEAIANADRPFDCCLLDINMPGMDGIDLCRRIRGIPGYRETPIIMLTAMADMASLQHAFKAGATDYTTKPFDIIDFRERLRSAQNSVRIRQKTAMAVSTRTTRSEDAHHAFDLSEELHLASVSSLVAFEALQMYLTQLSRGELAGVQVVAVKVNQIESVYYRASSKEFTNALTKVADAIGDVFCAAKPMMAYAGNGIFMTVSDGAAVPTSYDAETGIQSLLDSAGSGNRDFDSLQINVSVGRPIKPHAGKEQRASIAFNRAIVSAEHRELSKQGEQRSRSLQLVV